MVWIHDWIGEEGTREAQWRGIFTRLNRGISSNIRRHLHGTPTGTYLVRPYRRDRELISPLSIPTGY